MKRSRKLISILLVLALVLALAAACGGDETTTTTTTEAGGDTTTTTAAPDETEDDETEVTTTEPAATDELVTLTMLVSNTANLDGFNAAAAKLKDELNIEISTEIRPGGSEGENVVRTRLAASESTDLHVFNAGALLATLDPVANFVDLTNEPFMDTLQDSYKQTVTVDGKVFGVPFGSSFAGAWLYNKREYEALGLEIPSTWDELMENCEVIKEAGKTAVIASFGNDWTSQLILLADYHNVQNEDPTFAENFNTNKDKYATNESAFKAFAKMEEVWDRGFMNEDYNATTLDIALDMLVMGDGIHYPMLTNQIGSIAANYGQEEADNIGVFGQPGDDPDYHGLTVWMPDTFYVYAHNDKIEHALRYIEGYIQPSTIEEYAKFRKADGPYVVEGAGLPDDAHEGVKQMLPYYEEGKTAPALEFITAVKGPNSPQICIEVMSGIASAEDGAAKYDADVEVQARQLGLEGW